MKCPNTFLGPRLALRTRVQPLRLSSSTTAFALLVTALFRVAATSSVARFEVSSVSPHSIVLRMIGAHNISRFEMDVKIFDLDRLREFRRTELSAARYEDQVGV
jgi:hypothetical protein